MNTNSNRRAGFTLMELLLVITMVTVLMALLLPALGAAKARAKTAGCANNQREIGVAFSAFLGDHNGFYPYQFSLPKETFALTNPATGQPCSTTSYSWTTRDGWYYIMAPYINGLGTTRNGLGPYTTTFYTLMRCPANPWHTSNYNDPNEYYFGASVPYPPVSPSSYSLNNQLLPMSWGLPQSGTPCSYTWNNPGGWTKRTNLTDIQNPTTAAMMLENPLQPLLWDGDPAFRVDNPWTRANGAFSWLASCPMPFVGGGGLYGGSDASMVTNHCGPFDARLCPEWLRPDCNYQVSAFHYLGMNVLFFDGHVARISKATLFSNSLNVLTNGSCGAYMGPNSSPGGMFWTDGRGQGSRWNYNQFPGYDFY